MSIDSLSSSLGAQNQNKTRQTMNVDYSSFYLGAQKQNKTKQDNDEPKHWFVIIFFVCTKTNQKKMMTSTK